MSASLASRIGIASARPAASPRSSAKIARQATTAKRRLCEGLAKAFIRPTMPSPRLSRALSGIVDDLELILDFGAEAILKEACRGGQHGGAGKALETLAQIVLQGGDLDRRIARRDHEEPDFVLDRLDRNGHGQIDQVVRPARGQKRAELVGVENDRI